MHGSRIEVRTTVLNRLQAFPIHRRSRNVVAHLRHAVPGVEVKGNVEGKGEVESKGRVQGTTLERRAVLLAVWHVSCITPCNLCNSTPPFVRGTSASAKSPNSSLNKPTEIWSLAHDSVMCAAISSLVLPTRIPVHSIVQTLGA